MLSTLDTLVEQYLSDIKFIHPNETPAETQARLLRIKINHDAIYREIVDTFEDIQVGGGGVVSDHNIDGGTPESIYLPSQKYDGGSLD